MNLQEWHYVLLVEWNINKTTIRFGNMCTYRQPRKTRAQNCFRIKSAYSTQSAQLRDLTLLTKMRVEECRSEQRICEATVVIRRGWASIPGN